MRMKRSVPVLSAFAIALALQPLPLRGQFVYAANAATADVSGYIINPATGALTAIPGSPFPAVGTGSPTCVTADPTGRFAYVTTLGLAVTIPGDVSGHTINASTGALAAIPGSLSPAVFPNSVAVDPAGRFAYVTSNNGVLAYTIDATSGALTTILGSPFHAGVGPSSVAVDPKGKFAYVANGAGNNVSGHTIDATTGALTTIPGSPFPAGVLPSSVVVDPTGRFAYVANQLSDDVSGYTINASTGALTAIPGSPFPAMATAISVAVDPTGKFAYVANLGANSVSGYAIEASTGALTAIPGSPFPAGAGPAAVAVDPTGKYAYVANFVSSNVSGYTINAPTGALTAVPGSPFPTGGLFPRSVTVTGCNTPPAITGVSANPAVLWPPNQKMVDVTVSYDVTAKCGGPPVCALSVASNEPAGGAGNGDTSPDWIVLGPHNLDLRAERAGTDSARIYTITINCQDRLHQSAKETVTVTVPHDHSK